MRRLLAVVALTACGSDVSPGSLLAEDTGVAEVLNDGGRTPWDGSVGTLVQDLYQSGSRIKARMLVTADGAKAFNGWHDTERGENCSFGLASDGKIRCLPDLTTCPQSAYPLGTLFGDSSCAGPKLVAVLATCSAPACAVAYSMGDCNQVKLSVVRVGEKYSGSVVYYQASDGTCANATSGLVSYSIYYAGAETAPSSFVEAVEQLE
jgi:hypothetical protein